MNNEKQKKFLSYGTYILSLLIFGTNGLYVSKISLSSGHIVLLRTFIGGLLLTIIVLLKGGFDKASVRKERMPLLLGGVALGLNWIALFEAYRMLNVSLATLIYYVGPILVFLFSPILFKEKLTGKKILSAVIVALGLICISGSIALTGMNLIGLVVAIASAIFYASLIIFNKKVVCTDGLQTAAIELDVAFVVVLIYALCKEGIPMITASDIPYIAGIGVINTGLAYLLYFTGLQKLSGQSASLISYIDPVSALLFSAIFLQESMSLVQIIGAVLIIGGAMIGEIKKPNEKN